MKIIHNLENYIAEKSSIITIGTFDGLHIGHQKIISVKQIRSMLRGPGLPVASIKNSRNGSKIVPPSSRPHPRAGNLEIKPNINAILIKTWPKKLRIDEHYFFNRASPANLLIVL